MTFQPTVYQLLETQAKRFPDGIAIVAADRSPLTYAGLHLHVQSVVQSLNNIGISRNDRVAIVMPNGPEMVTAFLAVAAGATSAPLNPAYRQNEFDFYLSDLKAKAIIVQSGVDSPARAAAQARGIPLIELSPVLDAEAGIFTLTGPEPSDFTNAHFAREDDIALVLHTSGTTAQPKIVPLTQANICTSAHNIKTTLQLTPNDSCLNVMPLFHIHGLLGAVLSSMAAGATLVCTPGFEPDSFFEWLARFQPTWYTAVPTIHQAVLALAQNHKEIGERSSLRLVRSSSASLPPQVMAGLEAIFKVPVIESYGMTESSHQIASNPLPPDRRKPGSVGVAAGPEVAIMGKSGRLLPTGQAGEIVIKGESVTLGYENNPIANQAAFTNGWLRTGDEGRFDQDNYLHISGRTKEIINRGGEKVAPREIDEALLNHPAVAEAITFAVPHATLQEDVAAAVVVEPTFTVSEKELRDFAFTQLADFKVPSRIILVNEIPKGATGKLQRIGLAEQLKSQLEVEHISPRDEVEEVLARIWNQLLNVDKISVYHNFFALGGDSLIATQLAARVRAAFQIELPLPVIFKEPTLAEQAAVVTDLLLSELEALAE